MKQQRIINKSTNKKKCKKIKITKRLAVDTALLKLWVELKVAQQKIPFEIEDLLNENENSCFEKECQEKLMSGDQYYALALFYRSKKQLPKALHVLREIGSGKWKDDSPNAIRKAGILSIEILQTLNSCKDLWIYSQWVLCKMPREAMKIFTNENDRSEPLDYDEVRDFLNKTILG